MAQTDFFVEEGHSLLLFPLHMGVQRTFGVEVSILSMFVHPIVGRKAEIMDSALSERTNLCQ